MIRDFKALFGVQKLGGTAEILRSELTRAAGESNDFEKILADRLALLDVTTRAIVDGVDQVLKAPEKVRRIMLERLTREVERRLMMTGELPAADVRRAHEAIRATLPGYENVTDVTKALQKDQTPATIPVEQTSQSRQEPGVARRENETDRPLDLEVLLQRVGCTRDPQQLSDWRTPIGRVRVDGEKFVAFEIGAAGVGAEEFVSALRQFASKRISIEKGVSPAKQPLGKESQRGAAMANPVDGFTAPADVRPGTWQERLDADRASDPPGTVRFHPKDVTREEWEHYVQELRNKTPVTAEDLNYDHEDAVFIDAVGYKEYLRREAEHLNGDLTMNENLKEAAGQLADKIESDGKNLADSREADKPANFTNKSVFMEFADDKSRLKYYSGVFKELDDELERSKFPDRYKEQIARALASPAAMTLFTHDLSVRELIATAANVECRLQPAAVLANITDRENENIAAASATLREFRREMKNLSVYQVQSGKFVIATSQAAADVPKNEMDRHYYDALKSHPINEKNKDLQQWAYLAHSWRSGEEWAEKKDAIRALHKLDFVTRAEQVGRGKDIDKHRGFER